MVESVLPTNVSYADVVLLFTKSEMKIVSFEGKKGVELASDVGYEFLVAPLPVGTCETRDSHVLHSTCH